MLPHYIENPDESLWEQLPEWTEDSFAGILANVLAGRISNRFDLGGPNFTVDAACASSLAAIYLGCRELAAQTSDMMIVGGCDTVQNPFAYLCFSKSGALSPRGRSRAFDASADGIVISEGLAAVVLKRRDDAERDGDRIYAVIQRRGRCLRRAQQGPDRPTPGGPDAHTSGGHTPRLGLAPKASICSKPMARARLSEMRPNARPWPSSWLNAVRPRSLPPSAASSR